MKNFKKSLQLLAFSILSRKFPEINTFNGEKEEKIEVEGVVLKALPGLVFDIQLPEDFGGGIVKGYLSGKMRKNFIKIIEGDRVNIELSPYDLSKGRIIFREK